MADNNPYLPSAASLEGAAREGGAGFRDLSLISGALSILLALGAAIYLIAITQLTIADQAPALSPPLSFPLPSPVDELLAPMPLAQILLFLVTAITFLRWIYLAHRNLPGLGARYFGVSPRWAVACFFVPVLQLWAPFQTMRDLAKVSRNPVRWDLEDTPLVIVAWWTLSLAEWLLAVGGGLGAWDVNRGAIQVLDTVLTASLYVSACLIVRRIWRDQARQHAQRLQAGGVA